MNTGLVDDACGILRQPLHNDLPSIACDPVVLDGMKLAFKVEGVSAWMIL